MDFAPKQARLEAENINKINVEERSITLPRGDIFLSCGGQRPGPYQPPPARRHARKQPRRKLPPGHPTTRAKAAEIQIAGLSPALPLPSRRHCNTFNTQPHLIRRPQFAPLPSRRPPGVGGRYDRCLIKSAAGALCGCRGLTCQNRNVCFLAGRWRRSSPAASVWGEWLGRATACLNCHFQHSVEDNVLGEHAPDPANRRRIKNPRGNGVRKPTLKASSPSGNRSG